MGSARYEWAAVKSVEVWLPLSVRQRGRPEAASTMNPSDIRRSATDRRSGKNWDSSGVLILKRVDHVACATALCRACSNRASGHSTLLRHVGQRLSGGGHVLHDRPQKSYEPPPRPRRRVVSDTPGARRGGASAVAPSTHVPPLPPAGPAGAAASARSGRARGDSSRPPARARADSDYSPLS